MRRYSSSFVNKDSDSPYYNPFANLIYKLKRFLEEQAFFTHSSERGIVATELNNINYI